MRHLHFTQSLEPMQGGGLGFSAVALHRQLLAGGTSSVLCSTHGGMPQRPAESTFEFRRLKPDYLYFSPALFQEKSRLVRDSDVIHGHGLYVGTNFILGRESRRQSKALVYHVHGMFEPYILKRSRWKKRLVHWLFEDRNIGDVRLWRALTLKEADQIRACGYKAPIVIAPNGLIPANYLQPENTEPICTPLVPELKKTRKRLLFFGRLHPKKGIDLLLPAWTRLQSENRDWELVVAGPDENGYLKQVRNGDANGNVVFTGTVPEKSKVALFHSADLFVLPSYSEGVPMTVLEAMVCEVPVVATDACNISELTTASAGWECKANVESVTETLRAAIRADDAERSQRGRNGRRVIETHYSWPTVTAKLLEACAAHCN
jgi:poly(glycerol-phosphate) alpha-glucosyltransferase